MATVTHYIYSHYDPKQRDELERATGQVPEPLEPEEDPWQTESAFGVQRRIAAAPHFVPAIVSYDEINNMMGTSQIIPTAVEEKPNVEVSSWYRSLTRFSSAPVEDDKKPIASTSTTPAGPSIPNPSTFVPSAHPKPVKPTKNDWFITRALRSEPPTGRSTPSTLADILSRDPPPDTSGKPFTPPVFLHLGPSNRGYTMLERSGWNEGEPLGAGVVRRPRESDEDSPPRRAKQGKGKAVVKKEQREVKWDPDGDISEIRKVDVIDLTLSDPEDEPEDIKDEADEVDLRRLSTSSLAETDLPSSHNPKALLTPLPTVLKSDRLGIGLKAKTVGPHKVSKKRITHNQAALAQHIRETEELRRMKALVGRGSRGLARLAKAETESRRRLLASLNDS
ncbi:uncharacterized protein B0H18DRAFT_972547 [Fomitopsis serialis]|uniref:uncharacterized protein n=1 Tax=Fomitopsis serialis TaxID=139415 RepID=UPI002008B4F3|nr:uncharacterized protein B0H18DRAFT_972547 [Neoantrodia serialis]KAH9936156.1 hypothetical protein B0H18DRAFT_972547 [Neoantrodia serialis]